MTSKTEEAISHDILAEQVASVYRQLVVSIPTAPLGGGILAFMFWEQIPHADLLWWYASIVASLSVLPALAVLAYRSEHFRNVSINTWNSFALLIALAAGCAWGAAGFVLYIDDNLVYQLLLILWLYICAMLGMAASIFNKNMLAIFIVPLLAPIAIRTAMGADVLHLGLMAATISYGFTVYLFHLNTYKKTAEAFRLRFEIQNLSEALKHKKNLAEQAFQEKSQFIAAASHDLRQPIHAQGLLLAELDNYVDHSRGRRVLGGLESSLNSMRQLLDAILDISKLDAGVIKPSRKSFAMQALLEELENEFNAEFEDQGIHLRVRPCEYWVNSDRVLLGQILRNLMANACRYTQSGGVLLACRKRGASLSIEVWDTGIGIAAEQRENIFHDFLQLENPERDREKGLGLGLAIVKRTAKLLQHPLLVHSRPDKGTVFSITAPRVSARQTTATTRSVDELEHFDFSGIRVIVIDDDAAVREAMHGALSSWECDAVEFESVQQAIPWIAEHGYTADIIISDYRLRGEHTGSEAIRELRRAYNKESPAILITGDTAVERLRDVGQHASQVLFKPVRPATLRAALIQCLQLE